MRQVVIELDLIPISLNKLYRQFRGRTIISKEGREFKERLSTLLSGMSLSPLEGDFVETRGLEVEINFYSNRFYTKEGKIRKRYLDCDNLLKVTLDTVFKELAIDDSFITRLIVTKDSGLYDRTVIKVTKNCN